MTSDEIAAKFLLLSNKQTRDITELISKTISTSELMFWNNHLSECGNALRDLQLGYIYCSSTEERDRLINELNREIILCKQRLQTIIEDRSQDEILSQMTK